MEKLSHLVQIVSGLGLLIGIVLVVIELNQAKSLAQAQLTSDSWRIRIDRMIAQMGENSAAALAKACNDQRLTDEEKITIMSRYQLQLAVLGRDIAVNQAAGFESQDWEQKIKDTFALVFSATVGRDWWRSNRAFYRSVMPDVARRGDEILEKAGEPDCGLSELGANSSF